MLGPDWPLAVGLWIADWLPSLRVIVTRAGIEYRSDWLFGCKVNTQVLGVFVLRGTVFIGSTDQQLVDHFRDGELSLVKTL